MKEISLFNIFKAFFKIGAILLGGGYVIVPIMKEELIEKRGWLTDEEVLDFYCVSQCLPGIIAVNMAILTGYKLLKLKGAITSLLAMSLSPVAIIIIIAQIIDKITSFSFMEVVFWGVNLSVIILIYLTLKEIWKNSIVNTFCYVWFFIIFTLCAFKVSPVILITISIVFGVLLQAIKDLRGDKNAN